MMLDKKNKNWFNDFKQQMVDFLLPISLGQPTDNSINPQRIRDFIERSYQTLLATKHTIPYELYEKNTDSIPYFLEAIEEVVMNFLGRLCFASELEDRNEDSDLLIKMKIHQFLDFKHFDIDECINKI